jgi:hypothetical protein
MFPMLSELIKELQAALDSNGDMAVDMVIPGRDKSPYGMIVRRSVKPTAIFEREAGVLQITVE